MLYFGEILRNKDILIYGMEMTVLISVGALALGLVVALALALMRNSKNWVLSNTALWFVEFFRNTPFLAQLFFFFFGLPELGVHTTPIVTSIIALGVNTGAYNSEVVRAGLLSVEKGMIEASLALGMSKFQSVYHVVLPNAFRIAFKPLSSNFINLVLTTSATASITANDLTNSGMVLSSSIYRPFEIYLTILICYCLLTFTLSLITKIIDYAFISKSWKEGNA